jgi:hypothetical protein
MCRGFVSEYLPTKYEMNKADQAEFLSKTADFFREYNQFDMDRFGDEVMESDELKQSFKDYKEQYERDFDVDLADNFTLNEAAFRKGQRYFRSVMKLDKNFTVYIHGARNRVEQGEDEETGLKYYKFLYEHEN